MLQKSKSKEILIKNLEAVGKTVGEEMYTFKGFMEFSNDSPDKLDKTGRGFR